MHFLILFLMKWQINEIENIQIYPITVILISNLLEIRKKYIFEAEHSFCINTEIDK